MKENKKLISEILADVRHDMTDEEILNLLASSRISVNPEKESGKLTSLGQRAADSIAKFAGSWAFIFSFTGVLLAWMILNVLLAAKAFDPYPFILLNLVLSCVAAIQAPLIMMSQNRQEEKDRARAENDYKVNLKTEIMIEALHDKLNRILAREELLLQVQNFRRDDLPAIEQTIRRTLTDLCEQGLDREQIEASLASFEFRLRERDYGTMPRGLVFSLEILSSWLYGGDPAARLGFGPVFEQLRQAIGTGYYEALLRRLLLSCDHTASILMQPSATCGEARQAREKEALAAVLQTLSAQQQDEIRARQTRLAALQQEPDSPEALATIPHVCLSDLPRDPAPVPTELREDGSVIIHDLQTDGIVYTTAYFAADDLTPEELPYLTLLRSVLSQLPAGEMDAQELQKQLRLRLGSFSVGVSPITQLRDPQAYRLYATASCSALGSKLPEALSLAAAILTKTDFTNRGKLLEILRQLRDGLQQQIVSSGSSFAMLRASAALNAAGACTERSGGVDFYRWLCALEREFDARADACIAALQRLSEKLFVTARLRLSVTGGTEDERQTVLRVLREALPAGQAPGPAYPAPLLPIRREGIVIPSEVSFAAVCGDVHAYSGALRIACRAASLGHYWNEIRVQGGAYGTGLLLRDTGLATAYTYRDPDCARSRGAIGRTAAYLAAAASEPQEANIIGAISDAEPLLSPRLQGAVADTWLLKGMTQADRCRLRHEMLDTLPEQLAACGAQIGRALDEGVVCVLGPRTQLEACGDLDVQEL